MTPQQQKAVATVLLDALTALDVEDPAASARAVPLALAQLEHLIGELDETSSTVAYGARTLAHTCVALVATVKGVDRRDVIAALRPLFSQTVGERAA